MAWVDNLLNLAGLLLALAAWAGRNDGGRRLPAATLAGTLRPAATATDRVGWLWVGVLGVCLVRGLLGWLVGGGSDWTPRLNLGVLSVSFPVLPGWRGLGLMELYAVLSFGVWVTVFWAWMVLLSCAGQRVCEGNPVYVLVRRFAGPVARWPCGVRLVFPVVWVGGVWLVLEPVLAGLGLLPRPAAWPWRGYQALVLGLGCWRLWVPLVTGLLVLYWVNLYVYFGRHSIWDFLARVGRRWMGWLGWLPLRVARMDLAPVFWAALVWGAGYVADHGLDLPVGQRRIPSWVEVYEGLGRWGR
jgi:hypothetical protein